MNFEYQCYWIILICVLKSCNECAYLLLLSVIMLINSQIIQLSNKVFEPGNRARNRAGKGRLLFFFSQK